MAAEEQSCDLSKHTIQIKSEFLLDVEENSLSQEDTKKKTEDRDTKRDQRKKRRGRNKKRPRDAKIDLSKKACLSFMRGELCPFGEKCRYSHDLKELMAARLPDLIEVPVNKETGLRCPKFRLYGICEFGLTCRVGSEHISPSTGENLRREVDCLSPPVTNLLKKDVQLQLRRKKYPFICKRHFEVEEQENTDKLGLQVKETNLEPFPRKERKLIDFRGKVYVAPLTTVGNLPFRRIMKKFGADITCGEMAVGTCLLEGKGSEWALLKRHPCEDVFGVQIAVGFPDQATRVSELLEAECNVDWVDINMGCPLDLVCEKGAGAKLMMREAKLRESLVGISKTLSCPFTIKMRTGWDEAKPFAHKLIPKIQRWQVDGLNAIMIHGRSRLQRYTKLADWNYIALCANSQSQDLPKVPVIGNGDILNYSDYEAKIAREGLESTAMIARGALIKPWLPTEIKERRNWDISSTCRLDILKDFVQFGLEHWGSDQQGVNSTRRFLLEWLSFLYRYVPLGLIENIATHPQEMNKRPPPNMFGRDDLETLMMSSNAKDWIKISEILLGKAPDDFAFEPKHKANSFAKQANVKV